MELPPPLISGHENKNKKLNSEIEVKVEVTSHIKKVNILLKVQHFKPF